MASRGRPTTRASKRTGTRVATYDRSDNFRNWTADKLRSELAKAGIIAHQSFKVPALLHMYEDNIPGSGTENRATSENNNNRARDRSLTRDSSDQAETPPDNSTVSRSRRREISLAGHTDRQNSGVEVLYERAPAARSDTPNLEVRAPAPESSPPGSAMPTFDDSRAGPVASAQDPMMAPLLQLVNNQQQLMINMQQQVSQLMKDNNKATEDSTGNLTSAYAQLSDQGTGVFPGPSGTAAASATQPTFSTQSRPTMMSGPNGVPSNMLPYMDTMSPATQKAIREGKDVNLRSLILDGYEQDAKKSDLEKSRMDKKLAQPLSISEFIVAFSKYKSCMLGGFPQRQTELDLYENIIIRISNQFPTTPAFYDYHRMFSARAAEALRRRIKIDWSYMDQDIYSLVTAGRVGRSCKGCGSMTHATIDCTTIPSYKGPSDSPLGRSSTRADSSVDMRGRPRNFAAGKEICNNFNEERGCSRKPSCPFMHACAKCHSSDHNALACKANGNPSKTTNVPKG
jgi:hypothetical protein